MYVSIREIKLKDDYTIISVDYIKVRRKAAYFKD
jgi:hypothetical protein